MATPRYALMDATLTPYYHVMSRTVRKAWLCGIDPDTGIDHSHRRSWISSRLSKLCKSFTIELASYAIMSNHYHLVLYVNTQKNFKLDMNQILRRWTAIFNGSELCQRYLSSEALSQAELSFLQQDAEIYRQRLKDISWFMRSLNEPIARMANQEDNCSGRFWQGRFKSQALLDQTAILTCMAYVDLNPIRAGIAKTPQSSEFTSIQNRINRIENKAIATKKAMPKLKDFHRLGACNQSSIPFTLKDYLQLVDTTARAINSDNKAKMNSKLATILHIVSNKTIQPEQWLHTISNRNYGPNSFGSAIGTFEKLKDFASHFNKKWCKGFSSSRWWQQQRDS